MVTPPVYLDNHSTTRVDPRVVEVMLPLFSECYGNAGSTSHPFGWDARDAVDAARASLAETIQASEREIVFTSGATESNNLALRGVAERKRRKGNHLISVVTEHKAILDPLQRLRKAGFDISLLEVADQSATVPGWLDPQAVADAIRDDTLLVSVMLANNEIGVLQPLADIGRICKERGVLLHTDATQAVGKMAVDVDALQIDLMSFSAHKLYGPKGVGALYVRRRNPVVRLEAQIDGGGQEGGRRSGTLNVPGIVGFAHAIKLCHIAPETEQARLEHLRNQLFARLTKEIDGVELNGPPLAAHRLANNLNCSFAGVDGESLMMSMRNVAVSSGSACTSTDPEPSHVLLGLGLSEDRTRASLRFGLGRFNQPAEIEYAADAIRESVQRLRRLGA